MKTLALLLALACAAQAAPVDDITRRAEVTLTFPEVKSLLEAATPKAPPEEPPPVAAAITSQTLALSLDPAHPSGVATFEVDVLSAGWNMVPLIHLPFAIREASAPGATVLVDHDMLCVLVKQPGHLSVVLKFDLPDTSVQPGGTTAFRLTAAATGQFTVSGPPPHCTAILQSDAEQSSAGTLPIPLTGGVMLVRLVETRPVLPTTWTSGLQTLVQQRDDRLRVASRLHLVGNSGSGVSASLDLPAPAMEVEINGSDLQSVHFKSGNAGRKAAEITWDTPDVLERDLTVTYDLPAPESEGSWSIALPRLSGGATGTARTVLIPLPGTALSGDGGHPVRETDRLPGWMADDVANGGAWETAAVDTIAVESHALPRLEADTARIPTAEFHSRIVSDGAQLCEAVIRFRHRGPLHWHFTLPEKSELLSCEVDGHAVNPLLVGGGQLELLIGADPNAVSNSEVNFSYTAHSDAFAPVEGKLALSLPGTPLFIDELTWTLALPDNYESTAFEGNVEPTGGDTTIAFRKRLVRNETPSVEIYYRKRDTNR